MSGDSGHGSSHTDAYDELFHAPSIVDMDPLDNDKEETGNKVSLCWRVLCYKLKIKVGRDIGAFLVLMCTVVKIQKIRI